MTGYYIDIGYCSGYSGDAEPWQALKRVVAVLCEYPERIAAEAQRLGAPEELDGERLADYAERYREHRDLTVVVQEVPLGPLPEGEEFRPYVGQYASGGGPSRILKEHLRRAFCRLVIEAMHAQGIEVNLQVT